MFPCKLKASGKGQPSALSCSFLFSVQHTLPPFNAVSIPFLYQKKHIKGSFVYKVNFNDYRNLFEDYYQASNSTVSLGSSPHMAINGQFAHTVKGIAWPKPFYPCTRIPQALKINTVITSSAVAGVCFPLNHISCTLLQMFNRIKWLK